MMMRKKTICCLAAGLCLVCLSYSLIIHAIHQVPAAQTEASAWIPLEEPEALPTADELQTRVLSQALVEFQPVDKTQSSKTYLRTTKTGDS